MDGLEGVLDVAEHIVVDADARSGTARDAGGAALCEYLFWRRLVAGWHERSGKNAELSAAADGIEMVVPFIRLEPEKGGRGASRRGARGRGHSDEEKERRTTESGVEQRGNDNHNSKSKEDLDGCRLHVTTKENLAA